MVSLLLQVIIKNPRRRNINELLFVYAANHCRVSSKTIFPKFQKPLDKPFLLWYTMNVKGNEFPLYRGVEQSGSSSGS